MAPPEKLLPFMNKPTTNQLQNKKNQSSEMKASIDFDNHFKIPNKSLGSGQLLACNTKNCHNGENNDGVGSQSNTKYMTTATSNSNACNLSEKASDNNNSSVKVKDEDRPTVPTSAAIEEKKRKASLLPFAPIKPRPPVTPSRIPTPFGINKNLNSSAVAVSFDNKAFGKRLQNNNKQVNKGIVHQNQDDIDEGERNASFCVDITPVNCVPVSSSLKNPNANSSTELVDVDLNSSNALPAAEELRVNQDGFLEIPQLLRTCRQRSPIPFEFAVRNLRNIKKLGEGVYGEVFIAGRPRGQKQKSVFKIIPYGGTKKVNGEIQKSADEIEAEIIISREINRLRDGCRGSFCSGMAYMKRAVITQGKYPKILIEKWKDWHSLHKSENDCPNFDPRQKYVVLEYEYAGTDLEAFKFENAKQAYSLLIQVIHCLATAEAALAFEHRDLHWGNILVSELEDKNEPIVFTITGNSIQIPSYGIKATLIDYTISRLTNYDGRPIYTDLSKDETQFNGTEDYQFEIYRMMRRENGDAWHTFCSKTNIFWCHYLADKLISKAHFKEQESSTHIKYLREMKSFESSILNYNSCFEFCVSYYTVLMNMKKRQPRRYIVN